MLTMFPKRLSCAQRAPITVAIVLAVLGGAAAADAATRAGAGSASSGCNSAKPEQSSAPIHLDAGSSDLDAKSHLIIMKHGVTITQCDISVTADEAQATGLDFENSKWEFTGKVHIRSESQGDLRSDKANVEISHHRLARAMASGSPAQFEQTASSTGTPAKGHASIIDYDFAAGTVKLTGDAYLIQGDDKKMEAPSITYNVREHQVAGESAAIPGGRVHITIVPKSDTGSAPAPSSSP